MGGILWNLKLIRTLALDAVHARLYDDGYATAKDVLVSDPEVKEDAISAMEGCPTSAISEEKED